MKFFRETARIVLAPLLIVASGCAPSDADKGASERARIELEQRALTESAKGNDAITEMNKKLGRKVTPIDLGVAPRRVGPTPTPKP